ncbi:MULTISPECIES: DUF1284 domain-containing protein [Jannaschia]|uniref:DUF1284 domain-containing protein n=1 Tax=Jannaschia TaxID=188905 RepID=UPI002102869E|nr:MULTISPECIES: DUF1284 domain-containing protein [unclassified Jannaschia]
MTIRLRPHHVLCSIGFEGKGYSGPFIANMGHIVDGRLRAPGGEDIPILITSDADAICAPCPKRRGLGCEAGDRIAVLDGRHAAQLGLVPGETLSWGDCLDRVRARVTPQDLDRICAGCSWLDQGMCKTALARLRQTKTGRTEAAR